MKKVLFFAGLVITLGSCYNDSYDKLYPSTPTTNSCDTTTIGFAADIKPIFSAQCSSNNYSCHAPGAAGGVDLSTYNTTLSDYAGNGKLLKDINWSGGNNMPLGLPKISDCDINKITRWVHQGAQNN